MTKEILSQKIDALLPQTQCGLCGFKGCKPYADALSNKAADINLCPPGGVSGLKALGKLLDIDYLPFVNEMEKKAKPRTVAVIREDECIGCTKCIKACPVDAILGSAKQMHTVISQECTGCELCVAPCPVDCIDIFSLTSEITKKESNHFRKRYEAREARLNEEKENNSSSSKKDLSNSVIIDKKSYVQAALLRAKNKRSK